MSDREVAMAEESGSCPQSESQMVVALRDYKRLKPWEMNLTKGDVLILVDSSDQEWWKVEINSSQGFVPAEYLMALNLKVLKGSPTPPPLRNSSTQTDETMKQLTPVRSATRKPAVIKKRKLIGNGPRTDTSVANAVNRARVNHRTGRNIWTRKRAGPRDILKAPGLNKIALLVPKREKEEPQDEESGWAANVNGDYGSDGLERDSVPLLTEVSSVELLNSKDDGYETTPACQRSFNEKFSELEKVVEEKNHEIEQLKDKNGKILEYNAHARAQSLKVVRSPCKTNDVCQEEADDAHGSVTRDSDSEYFPSGTDSEEEMFSVVPRGASATAKMRTPTAKQPTPPSKSGEKIIETNSAAFDGDCVVQAADTSGSSGGVEDSCVIPAATGAPSSTTKHSEDSNVSNEPAVLHKIDEKLLGISQFGCICGMRYKRRDALLEHVLKRSGTKYFKCEHCPEVFALMGNLNGHLRKVHKTQPKTRFGCRICGDKFKTQLLLSQHQKIIHHRHFEASNTHGYAGAGLQGHLCKCGRSYQNRKSLGKHIATNMVPNNFKCPHCVAQYKECGELKRHVRRDHDLPNYDVWGCYKCGATFPNRVELSAHKNMNHNKST